MSRTSRLHVLMVAILLPLAATAQTNYFPYGTAGEMQTDLVTYEGIARTVVVRILNLTPYRIEHTEATSTAYGDQYQVGTTLADVLDRDRLTAKAFFFAPVGVPAVIPGVPPEAYTDGYVNTVTRPYEMVFSWNERAGRVEQSRVSWVVRGVQSWVCPPPPLGGECTPRHDDVHLGLWVTRPLDDPGESLYAGFFGSDFVGTMTMAVAFAGVITDPFNPLNWYGLFIAAADMADPARFEEEQVAPDDGIEMYVASYPIPAPFTRSDPSQDCYLSNNNLVENELTAPSPALPDPRICTPQTVSGTADDGTDAQWADAAGPGASELITTIHVLRGRRYLPHSEGGSACAGKWGSVPIVNVTIWTRDQYLSADVAGLAHASLASRPQRDPGAAKLVAEYRKFYEKYDRAGLLAIREVVLALAPEAREQLRAAVLTVRSGGVLDKDAHKALHMVIVAARARLTDDE
ncbi:hypothetical protein [Anaeromyxobacter dehalogenans]|uniref:Uncharacterized protein n=1 Tax=Anaeromyxobacter dehalogenans (strain 2CP-C) TaxID=290397 RepID=Q2ILW9_ANADE|nr:hypothetical protein [Anaeromyxobacter dehalogenans]ABC79798.1 hypothetical protein Adeh_0020 [Anaeromyxobacter dehalogenans 2CP-C]